MSGAFDALGVDAFFIRRLAERGITRPTAVQALVIPKILAAGELIFSSDTGTGKTFAYLIPLLQRLVLGQNKTGSAEIIIAAPTYELCSQIKGEVDFLLEGIAGEEEAQAGEGAARVRAGLCIGSANISRQIETLKKEKPLVVVGNPGRLLQLARMGKLKLRGLKALVLDEGDRLTAKELFAETSAFAGLAREQGDRSLKLYACSATMPEKAKNALLPFFGPDAGTAEEPGREVLRDSI
ncbi:MAG: DEAD/DEAH box helicase, partial [Spirochaetaceae bacterium]|nr:DEAD/DEAH box helicase [Spirochaetaceae bacterium]